MSCLALALILVGAGLVRASSVSHEAPLTKVRWWGAPREVELSEPHKDVDGRGLEAPGWHIPRYPGSLSWQPWGQAKTS